MRPEELKSAMRRLEAVLSERWEPQRQDERSFAFPWVAGCIPLSCYAQVNPDMDEADLVPDTNGTAEG